MQETAQTTLELIHAAAKKEFLERAFGRLHCVVL